MLLFVREFLRHRRQVGSVWPSSPMLADALTKPLVSPRDAKRVLEVGPGTGPVTRRILQQLQSGDLFEAVEINREFCEKLEKEQFAAFRALHPDIKVRLYCAPIESAPVQGPFDLIVCGLPFNNFPPALVRSIFRRLLDLLAPKGQLVYFEYVGVRAVKSQFVDAAGRRRLKQLGATVKVLRRRHAGRRELVIGNFPPAYAMSLTRES